MKYHKRVLFILLFVVSAMGYLCFNKLNHVPQKGPTKFIFTGGPGAGKTCLLLALESQFEYSLIPEAAADVKDLMIAEGNAKPWLDPNLNQRILDLQQVRIREIANDGEEMVLMDRSPIDILAYINNEDDPCIDELLQEIHQISSDPSYCKTVFLVENLGAIKTNSFRHETYKAVLRLEKAQEENYRKLGFNIVRIKSGTVAERARQVVAELAQLEHGQLSK